MATRRSDTLEVAYIDVQVRDTDLKRGLERIGRSAQTEARKLGTAFTREATPGLNGAATAARALKDRQKELDTEVQRLSLSVRNQRNAYVQGRITQDQYEDSTRSLKGEINQLLDSTNDLSVAQQTRLNTSAATAERGLATLRGEASRLGLAQQVQIGLTNTFGNQLRSLGPAGTAAAGGLGLLSNGFASLRQPLDASAFSFDRFISLAARAPQVIALATAAVGTLAVVGLARLASEAARVADEIDKASASVGLAAEEYQELSFAFSQLGLDSERFRTALGNLNTRLGEAIEGNERYERTLTRLGVNLEDVVSGTVGVGDVLSQVADGIAALPTTAEQAAAAATLFGRSIGNQLLPALQQGSGAIDALRQSARDLGLVISGDAIISLVEYKDQVEALQQQFQTARVEIAAAFLPILRDVLIPLIQNTLVPALQTAAARVGDFSQSFLDAGPAGAEFRRNVLATVAPLIVLGQSAVAVGALVVAALSGIAAVAARTGAIIGGLSAAFEIDPGQASRGLAERLTQQIFGIDLSRAPSASGGRGGTPNIVDQVFGDADEAASGYADALERALNTALGAITFDAESSLTDAIIGLQRALDAEVGNLFSGAARAASENGEQTGKEFVEGSLAFLRQQRQRALDAYNEAGDDAGRAFASALLDSIDEAIAEISRRFDRIRIPIPAPIIEIDTRAPSFTPPTAPAGLVPTESERFAEFQRELRETERAARVAAFALTRAEAAQRDYTDSLRSAEGIIRAPVTPDSVLQRIAVDAERRFLEARLTAAARIGAEVARGGGPSVAPLRVAPDLEQVRQLTLDTVRALVQADAPITDILTALERLRGVAPDLAREFDELVIGFNTARAEATRIVRSQAGLRGDEDALQGITPSDASADAEARARLLAQLADAERQLDQVRASALAVLDETRLPSQNLIDALRELGDEFEGLGVLDSAEEVRDLADALFDLEAGARAAREAAEAQRQLDQANQELAQSINQGFQATNQFASAVQNLAKGDAAGGVSGLFGAAASIASFFGPQGAIFGAIFSGIGSLISTLFGGRSQREDLERTRASGAAARGAPAIEFNLTVNQQLALASLTDPDSRRALDGAADSIVERIDRLIDTLFARVERLEATA